MGRFVVLQYILVFFLKADAQASEIDMLSFERTGEETVSVCVDAIPKDTKSFILFMKPELPIASSVITDTCISFEWDIAGNEGATRVVLNALDEFDYPTGSGVKDVTIPVFPSHSSTLGEKSQGGTENVLRITGDKSTFRYNVISTILVNNANQNAWTEYFIGLVSEIKIKLCDNSNDVLICDIPLTNENIIFKNAITVESAILKYTDDTNADITINISDDGSTDTSTLDIIINLTPSVLCEGDDITGQTCTIPWTPGNFDVDIRLVQLSAGELFDYKTHTIKDCELLAGGIDDSTLEVRWLQFGIKIYQLTLLDDSGVPSGDSLQVHCENLNLNHCFAYFIIDTQGGYSVKVQELDVAPKTDSQVQSKLYTMPPTGFEILHIDAEAHQNSKEARTTVCFHHTSQEMAGKSFSHYEFVMINSKGQWLKHKLITHKTKGNLCFTPFTIYTNDFDITEGAKIIVTQRAEDGFTVLASGNTHVTFGENI